MKKLIMLAVFLVIGSSAMARFGYRGGMGQSPAYDVTAETVFNATVTGPDEVVPARVRIQLADGRELSLFTAPVWYLQQQDLLLTAGTNITVTGVITTFRDGTEGVVARQITTGNEIHVFRNESGVPLWTARRGMNGAPGNVNGCGVLSDTLSALPVQNLSDEETAGLLKMREEEKLARDVYLTLFQQWNLRIFNRISQSEQSHMDAIKALLDKYELDDPVANTTVGEFSSPEMVDLYRQLVEQGRSSLVDALTVGATIEDLDIADLKQDLAGADNDDLRMVYQNLMKGSRNHLRSFIRVLGLNGGTYDPQYLSREAYDAILASPMERGVVLDGDGNTYATCGGNGTGSGSRGRGRNGCM